MPKIARSIELNRDQAPVDFYLHLGDLRRMNDIDCDIVTATRTPLSTCKMRREPLDRNEMSDYLNMAWKILS